MMNKNSNMFGHQDQKLDIHDKNFNYFNYYKFYYKFL